MASDSGRHGESYILQILVSPLPLRKYNLTGKMKLCSAIAILKLLAGKNWEEQRNNQSQLLPTTVTV